MTRGEEAEDTLPAAIRRVRLQLGLSQERFGERLGVKDRAVKHWEAGDHVPDEPQRSSLIEMGVAASLFEPYDLPEVRKRLRRAEAELARVRELLE